MLNVLDDQQNDKPITKTVDCEAAEQVALITTKADHW